MATERHGQLRERIEAKRADYDRRSEGYRRQSRIIGYLIMAGLASMIVVGVSGVAFVVWIVLTLLRYIGAI